MKDDTEINELPNDLESTDDAVEIEEVELEDVEENSVQKIKSIQLKLKECEKEKSKHQEDLQRAKAEFLNAKRRMEDERLHDKQKAVTDQIEKLLPLSDSFQMAMKDKDAWDAIDPTWRKGIEGIYTQLSSILASYNVSELDPTGEEFNPALHEAVANVPVAEVSMNHKIVSVVQNGFVRTIDGKQTLIRPARVTVGEYIN